MSKLLDCLSTLSILATSPNACDAGGKARGVIDGYVGGLSAVPDRLASLRELYDGFIRMMLDTDIFAEIEKDIEARIVELTDQIEFSGAAQQAA